MPCSDGALGLTCLLLNLLSLRDQEWMAAYSRVTDRGQTCCCWRIRSEDFMEWSSTLSEREQTGRDAQNEQVVLPPSRKSLGMTAHMSARLSFRLDPVWRSVGHTDGRRSELKTETPPAGAACQGPPGPIRQTSTAEAAAP
ncbi:hypothetical protein FQA47_020282 [Oryzias melastigma]|uniref:Uncharacterized protein n=1 Tax=Oryzias melastigma TaxID=30732 RepID=A0A834FLI6_ORYME|nr:hypothetical protein FQA47_020282 [Oryzias melastigma]